MAIPRSRTVDESVSGIYHCMSRCVRQAHLLATGPDGAIDDRRRAWVVSRVRLLTSAFAIDCVSLAVMSNHLHLLLRTLPEVVDAWSDAEVAYRWLLVRPPIALRKRLGIPPHLPPQREEIMRLLMNPFEIEKRRRRMSSLSWFMKELKEWLARRANREDGRTGAFWEERFRSYRVHDEVGILLCSVYIDLNPVRAGLGNDPLATRHTSPEEHMRRLDRELWREVALAPESNGRCDRGARLESFLATFDDALFEPAIPARREPYGTADSLMGPCDATFGPLVADGGFSVKHRRTPPAVALLPLSLGDYFRRLLEVAQRLLAEPVDSNQPNVHESDAADAGNTVGRTNAAADGEEAGGPLERLARLLDEGDLASLDAALAATLRGATLRGGAIGTARSLAEEARRRGVRRVALALS
ncbi:MAG: hypothetical protein KDA22_02815 [Phycisphaerales bacterium]|nr:hypothetical protein [Phycisphaerales bacterium]